MHVHVHLDQQPTRTHDADDDGEGKWVTINGAHVHIGKGGKIDKGPKELMDKSEHGAHSHTHADKAKQHQLLATAKQLEGHEDAKEHKAIASHHSLASRHYAAAEQEAAAGNIRSAAHTHNAAKHEAKQAEQATARLAAKQAAKEDAAGKAPFQKPKSHVALHTEAEEDVKGSEKHEAEHKRLMGNYDKAKQDWERTAINRQIQNNQTFAVQHKAQGLHHKAMAASEYAKETGAVEHHKAALEAIDKADKAHGQAGGVGYQKKQDELRKMAKGHHAEVDKHEKAQAKAAGKKGPVGKELHETEMNRHAEMSKLAQQKGQTHAAKAHADAYRAHLDAHRGHGLPEYEARKATAAKASSKADDYTAGEEAKARIKKSDAEAHKHTSKADYILKGKHGGGASNGALTKAVGKAAKKAAEEAADQDPKHKK